MRVDDDGSRPGFPDPLAGVPDAVYRLDSEGRFRYLNSAAEKLLERSADDLLGRRGRRHDRRPGPGGGWLSGFPQQLPSM